MEMAMITVLVISLFNLVVGVITLCTLAQCGGYIHVKSAKDKSEQNKKSFKEKQDEAFADMMNLDINRVYGIRAGGDNGNE